MSCSRCDAQRPPTLVLHEEVSFGPIVNAVSWSTPAPRLAEFPNSSDCRGSFGCLDPNSVRRRLEGGVWCELEERQHVGVLSHWSTDMSSRPVFSAVGNLESRRQGAHFLLLFANCNGRGAITDDRFLDTPPLSSGSAMAARGRRNNLTPRMKLAGSVGWCAIRKAVF